MTNEELEWSDYGREHGLKVLLVWFLLFFASTGMGAFFIWLVLHMLRLMRGV